MHSGGCRKLGVWCWCFTNINLWVTSGWMKKKNISHLQWTLNIADFSETILAQLWHKMKLLLFLSHCQVKPLVAWNTFCFGKWCSDENHTGRVAACAKTRKITILSSKSYYLCMPPGCWEIGGESGTSSSPIPQDTQHDSFPEVNRVCLLLPSASKERGTSDEAYGEDER